MELNISQQQQQKPAALTKIDSILKKNYFSHSVGTPTGEKMGGCFDGLLLKANALTLIIGKKLFEILQKWFQ